jgi:hypothetical protein
MALSVVVPCLIKSEVSESVATDKTNSKQEKEKIIEGGVKKV